MGGAHSSIVRDCLVSAVKNDSNLVVFHEDFAFGSRVPLYNLNLPVVPTAITYPQTTEQIADIVQCAAENGLKVQAYSGGHSYGNYGMYSPHFSHDVTDSFRQVSEE